MLGAATVRGHSPRPLCIYSPRKKMTIKWEIPTHQIRDLKVQANQEEYNWVWEWNREQTRKEELVKWPPGMGLGLQHGAALVLGGEASWAHRADNHFRPSPWLVQAHLNWGPKGPVRDPTLGSPPQQCQTLPSRWPVSSLKPGGLGISHCSIMGTQKTGVQSIPFF